MDREPPPMDDADIEDADDGMTDEVALDDEDMTDDIPLDDEVDEKEEEASPAMEDEPLVDEPLVDEPLVDEPLVDEPLVDEPLVDEPLVDEPLVDEPLVDEPLGGGPPEDDGLDGLVDNDDDDDDDLFGAAEAEEAARKKREEKEAKAKAEAEAKAKAAAKAKAESDAAKAKADAEAKAAADANAKAQAEADARAAKEAKAEKAAAAAAAEKAEQATSVDKGPLSEEAPAAAASKPKPKPAASAPASGSSKRASTISTSSAAAAAAPSEDDGFTFDIAVTEPLKMGDGMSSYIAYKVTVKTDIPAFKSPNLEVKRRYSDFLTLARILTETYPGVIVPPCPPKDAIGGGMVKFKTSGTEITPFIERRCKALDRYMKHIVIHPTLRKDETLRMFLETDMKLPKPKGTTLTQMVAKFGAFNEPDQWFADKAAEVETLDKQLQKLHVAVEGLVDHRRDLAISTQSFAEQFAALADAEEVESLTRAMHQLADVEAKVSRFHLKQADRDFYSFAEILKDYIATMSSIRVAFQQRMLCFKDWQSAENNLLSKREAKAKIEQMNKVEKMDQATKDVTMAEELVVSTKREFEEISKRVRREMDRFDLIKVREFQEAIVAYIEAIMTMQHQTVKAWETFLPEARAIGSSS